MNTNETTQPMPADDDMPDGWIIEDGKVTHRPKYGIEKRVRKDEDGWVLEMPAVNDPTSVGMSDGELLKIIRWTVMALACVWALFMAPWIIGVPVVALVVLLEMLLHSRSPETEVARYRARHARSRMTDAQLEAGVSVARRLMGPGAECGEMLMEDLGGGWARYCFSEEGPKVDLQYRFETGCWEVAR